MERALTHCDTAADAVAALDPRALSREDLALGALGLQRHLDRIKAVQARLLTEADRQGVWQGTGARNIADWLAGLTNTSYGDAKSRKQLGDALAASPELADAVDNGEVSAATAEALHDAVTGAPEGANVAELVTAVKGAGPRDAKAAAEKWREVNSSESDEEREERRFQQRSVRSTAPKDGLVTSTLVLPLLAHRQFIKSISHVAGLGAGEGDTRTSEQRLADGLTALCDAYAKGEVTGGRERPTMLLVFDIASGEAHTADGDRIPEHVARHLMEHAHLQRVLVACSKIVDLGRRVRAATDDQYRALVARDGGCRWPGCHMPAAWCEVDHLIPWEHGGLTDLLNLALFCTHHHHEKHRPGVEVLGNADTLRLRLANGTIIDCRRRVPAAA